MGVVEVPAVDLGIIDAELLDAEARARGQPVPSILQRVVAHPQRNLIRTASAAYTTPTLKR